MIKRSLRISMSASLMLLALGALAQTPDLPAVSLNIDARELSRALIQLTEQTGMQLIYPAGNRIVELPARALKGTYSPAAALDELLKGSGLKYEIIDKHTIVIIDPKQKRSESQVSGVNTAATTPAPQAATGITPAAAVAQASPAAAGSPAARAEPRNVELEEIIVTASKRRENLREVSGSITAFTGSSLETMGASSFSGYLGFVPGAVFNATTPGISTVTLRGVSTTTALDQGQGATGYFINDVPLTDPYYSVGIPDIDAFDVENVTVMRGPQGTLFGSASLGGAINYTAAPPKLDGFEMRGQAAVESTKDGATGGSGKIALNVPLVTDTLAVRGVYVYREDAGFIDNLGTGVDNDGKSTISGGRLQVLWQPVAGTQVRYLYLDQTQKNHGDFSDQPLDYGDLKTYTYVSNRGEFGTLIHNLRLDQDVGIGTLTATATYHDKTQSGLGDYTESLGPYVPGVIPLTDTTDNYSRGNTFEIRLASVQGRVFEYLIGAMYDETKERFTDKFSGPGAADAIEEAWGGVFGPGIGEASAPNDVFWATDLKFTGKEQALFGEAAYHFSEAWKLTLGGRLFETRTKSKTFGTGFFQLLSSGELEQTLIGDQKQSGFTPKAAVTWTPTKQQMAYALVSKGFRYGGPNVNANVPGADIPPSFKSDSLINYELGTRSTLFDNRLLLDITAFYIDWSDIQLRLGTPTGLAYGANAGKARNFGVETALSFQFTQEIALQTGVTYLDAELTQDFDPGAGADIIKKGTTLPGASKWKISNVLSYDWRSGPFSPSFVLTHQYISTAQSDFVGGIEVGGYNKFNASITAQPTEAVGVTLYANNIGNKLGATNGYYYPGFAPYVRFVERPFTCGLRVDLKF